MKDGDTVAAEDIPDAVTKSPIRYEDGAAQRFETTGSTTYVDAGGHRTVGEWYVDPTGRFCSYWPPTYRACYELSWVVDDQDIAGLRFRDGTYISVGRYDPGALNDQHNA